MEKAWEKVWDKACKEEAWVEEILDRAVHNSPPPLDDVGGGVTDMLDEKDPVKKMLEERGKTHGDYGEHAEISQCLKEIVRCQPSWVRLTDCQKEALEMIAHKIGRILAGNPDHVDHWDDIAGYATLVSLDIISRLE